MGRMSRACVFDMDGVLIDTEPVWRQVEIDVFARVGVALTDEQLRDTWGMRIEEVVDHWYQQRPWNGIRPHAVQREIVREMVEYVRTQGEPMVGAIAGNQHRARCRLARRDRVVVGARAHRRGRRAPRDRPT